MKRAPIVLSGTALGLVGVIGYHAVAPGPTVASAGSTTKPVTTAAASATSTTSTANTSTTATHTTSGTSSASAVRTATGEDVSYQYGDLQVKVTMTGTKITDVSVVSLNASDPHSEQIDTVAVPQLRQEAIAASSAKIDGVSGASYTSAAYEQSLQSALDKLSSTSVSS